MITRYISRRLFPISGAIFGSGGLLAREGKRISAARALIQGSRLFDASWYRTNNPDVAQARLDPADHYLRFGGLEGRPASPAFHSAAYLSLHPDVARANVNPLVHYLESGQAEGRRIQSVADFISSFADEYRDDMPALAVRIARSALFDPDWFRRTYPHVADLGTNEIVHLICYGFDERLSPGPAFDASAYLDANPDVAGAAKSPIVHYLEDGEREGRPIVPVRMANRADLRALIATSPFFDETWYADTYRGRIPDGTAPIDHFLDYGYSGDFNPGPRFDAQFYLRRNADVDESDTNPLVHYLQFGKTEGRKIRPVPVRVSREQAEEAEAVALIRSTPLFDPVWYAVQYTDVSRSGLDPAVHYVRHGGAEKRRPSIYFDPDYYLGQIVGDDEAHANPLLHFLRKGSAAGLRSTALVDFVPASRRAADVTGDADPLVQRPDLALSSAVDFVTAADLASDTDGRFLTWGGRRLARLEAEHPVGEDLLRLDVLRRLMNLPESVLGPLAGDGRPTIPSLATYRGMGPRLRTGPQALSDLWFSASTGLRLRFGPVKPSEWSNEAIPLTVVRAYQPDLADPSVLTLCGEGLVQADGPTFLDLQLDTPLAPMLLVASDLNGVLSEIGLVPFPSLTRGGLHHGELIASAQRPSPQADLQLYGDALVRELLGWDLPQAPSFSVAGLLFDPDGAIGLEKVFSPVVREWLLAMFGVAVNFSATTDHAVAGRTVAIETGEDVRPALVHRPRRSEGCVLSLPVDALPSLAALASRRLLAMSQGGDLAAPVVIADGISFRGKWVLSFPPITVAVEALQPQGAPPPCPVLRSAGGGEPVGRAPHPLAIRYPLGAAPSNAALLMPRAPDAGGPILRRSTSDAERASWAVSVIVLNACEQAGDALRSLSAQNAGDLEVVIMLQDGTDVTRLSADLRTLFPGRHRVEPTRGGARADISAGLAASDGERPYVLILEAETILHDPRTLETLLTMIAADRVASAGCAILRESAARRGTHLEALSVGYFPTQISLLATPQLVLSPLNGLEALPVATFPVAANGFECQLVRRDVLLKAIRDLETSSFAGRFDLQWGLSSLSDGWHHLCTTGVRATSVSPFANRDELDPLGAQLPHPLDWGRILANVTMLRELR